MNKNIAVLRGDGIGPEIVNEAIKVLDTVAEKYGHKFTYNDADIGGCQRGSIVDAVSNHQGTAI